MKIAYLLNSVSRKAGGLLEICKRLAQTTCHKKEIVLLGVEDEFTKTDIIEWAPLRPTVFSPVFARSFGYAPGYGQYLADICPDIAHVHGLWTYPSFAAYRWHRRTKRPLIYTAHGMLAPWALRNSAWKKRLVRALWDQAGHEAQLRKLTTDLRLLTSVIFLGPRFGAARDACYRACDAFVLPSLSEGLPMTVLEAWAYAKPVLMTPECNLPEGFVAWAALQIGTTSKEIAAGLKQLVEMSDDDRKAMGASGGGLVEEAM